MVDIDGGGLSKKRIGFQEARARGRSGNPQGPQRATGGMERAERRPHPGGPEGYTWSTRSPGGGAWRWKAGMRPDSLLSPQDGLGKRMRPCFLKGFSDDNVRHYKKRPISWLITSPKGTLQAPICLHRYSRDTVNAFFFTRQPANSSEMHSSMAARTCRDIRIVRERSR
jgi:hypothetical protein